MLHSVTLWHLDRNVILSAVTLTNAEERFYWDSGYWLSPIPYPQSATHDPRLGSWNRWSCVGNLILSIRNRWFQIHNRRSAVLRLRVNIQSHRESRLRVRYTQYNWVKNPLLSTSLYSYQGVLKFERHTQVCVSHDRAPELSNAVSLTQPPLPTKQHSNIYNASPPRMHRIITSHCCESVFPSKRSS